MCENVTFTRYFPEIYICICIYLHCAVYSKVHMHCIQAHHSGFVSIGWWLLFYNLHNSYQLFGLHFVNSGRKKKQQSKSVVENKHTFCLVEKRKSNRVVSPNVQTIVRFNWIAILMGDKKFF